MRIGPDADNTSPQAPGRVHLLIPTHTTRHLDACVAALAIQTAPPAAVVVSCDTDAAAIGRLLDALWPRVAAAIRTRHGAARVPVLIHTSRPHSGRPRPSQARNNGLRALDQVVGLHDQDLVVGIDGDIVLSPDAIRRHDKLAASGWEVVIPFRVMLDQERTARVTAESLLTEAPPAGGVLEGLAQPSDLDSLRARHARYERQRRLRSGLPRWLSGLLVKAHKPKIISAHYAAAVARLRAVNGFDEEYTDYGYEDDDLGRRLHALKPPPRVRIAVRDILAFHLWHPSRAPASPTDAPGYARFRGPFTVFARHGWTKPAPQPEPTTRVVQPD